MKPRKGQFKFSAPPKISHEELPVKNPNFLGPEVTVKATRLGKPAGELKLGHLDAEHVWNDPKKGSASGAKGIRKSREVLGVDIPKAHRRKGVATAMWKYAKENGLEPVHSPLKTEVGEAWAKKVGD